MNSKERLVAAMNHKKTDKVPVDLGATAVTGIHASTLYHLRNGLGLPEKPIIVHEVFQQLGFVEEDVRKALGVDVVGIGPYRNFIGNRNTSFKKTYTAPPGIKSLVCEEFEYDVLPDDSRLAYPQGDRTVAPSLKMPSGAFFYDCIERSQTTVDDETDPYEDYKDAFGIMDDEEINFLKNESEQVYNNSDLGAIINFGGAAFGDAAILPAAHLKNPKGIRKLEEWYAAHLLNPGYIQAVFEMQSNAALKNLKILWETVGDKAQAVFMSGTDFGTQRGEIMGIDTFRTMYIPYYKKVNDWVHQNTTWKTFYHSCGSISNFIEDFIDAGVDILNPVQCSAFNMDAKSLKDKYGDRIVFWGGGIDTQHTLPFGTPDECYKMTTERLKIFSENGGYIFNPVHNIQAKTSVENIIEMYKAVRDFNR